MTTNPIAALFGRSPFGPMQEHMKVTQACCEELIPLFEAIIAGDEDHVAAIRDDIFTLEADADRLKNELRSHLPKSFFMPVDRRDLLDLLHAQDSMADTAQDIAGLVVLRQIQIPDFLKGSVLPFVRRNVDAVQLCSEIIAELDELLEAGFRGRPVDRVLGMIGRLNEVEDDTDAQGIAIARAIFEHEDEMKPVAVFFWYNLLEMIGDIADYAEDVGDRLRLLVAR